MGKVQIGGYEARDRIYSLCCKKKYFVGGTNSQYEKMFKLVEEGKHLEIIATVIWLCSKAEYEDVYRDCYETLMVDTSYGVNK